MEPASGDELPPLAGAAVTVVEASPDPPHGPIRDQIAALAEQQAEDTDHAMGLAVAAYLDRMLGVTLSRMRGPTARKGTRWWVGAATGATPRPVDTDYVVPAKLVEEIEAAVRPVFERTAARTAAEVAKRLGAPDGRGAEPFTVDAAELRRAVDAALAMLTGVAQRYAQVIRERIAAADLDAGSLEGLLERIDAAYAAGRSRLLMAGRTIGTALRHDVAVAQARMLGVTHAQWLSKRDPAVRSTHRKADGQVRLLDDRFRVGMFALRFPGDPTDLPESWPEVANCFVAGTEISASDVEGSFRAPYVGEIVTIRTAQGRVLTGTPNHPVFTQRGWVGLGDLNELDHLVCAPLGENIGSGIDPDVQGSPTLIEQVHDTLTRDAPIQRMPDIAVNFHGDRPAGQVDVVAINSPLRMGRHAAFHEEIRQYHLPGGGEACQNLAGPGSFRSLSVADNSPANGNVSGLHESPTTSFIETLPAQGVGIAAATGLNPSTAKPGPNGRPVNFEGSRQRQFALPVAVAPNNFGAVKRLAKWGQLTAPTRSTRNAEQGELIKNSDSANSENGANLTQCFAGVVQLDRVGKIERSSFAGHVYTLQTTSGTFLANSILTKNCRCGLLLGKPDPARIDAAQLTQAALRRAGDQAAAKALLRAARRAEVVEVPAGVDLPGPAYRVAIPQPVIGYRSLTGPPTASVGQWVLLAAPVLLGLAATTGAGQQLTVAIPAGTVVTVVGGAVVLEQTALEVIGSSPTVTAVRVASQPAAIAAR